jgi:hypothetical protein
VRPKGLAELTRENGRRQGSAAVAESLPRLRDSKSPWRGKYVHDPMWSCPEG